ncbi:hypothetical protein V493_03608 [Pseudogymnoascus sp. VKM F-4281 (FW-2241)]|nr:hypothetical protein V493_03608 [Pseudogymnoascus sp. VKM F-4281 (FW-2241)]
MSVLPPPKGATYTTLPPPSPPSPPSPAITPNGALCSANHRGATKTFGPGGGGERGEEGERGGALGALTVNVGV